MFQYLKIISIDSNKCFRLYPFLLFQFRIVVRNITFLFHKIVFNICKRMQANISYVVKKLDVSRKGIIGKWRSQMITGTSCVCQVKRIVSIMCPPVLIPNNCFQYPTFSFHHKQWQIYLTHLKNCLQTKPLISFSFDSSNYTVKYVSMVRWRNRISLAGNRMNALYILLSATCSHLLLLYKFILKHFVAPVAILLIWFMCWLLSYIKGKLNT